MPTSSKNGKRNWGRTGVRWERARRRVLAASSICHVCGTLINQELRYPDPMSPSVDHVVPASVIVAESGNIKDPRLYDPANLKPAHLACNQKRGVAKEKQKHPTSRNWRE